MTSLNFFLRGFLTRIANEYSWLFHDKSSFPGNKTKTRWWLELIWVFKTAFSFLSLVPRAWRLVEFSIPGQKETISLTTDWCVNMSDGRTDETLEMNKKKLSKWGFFFLFLARAANRLFLSWLNPGGDIAELRPFYFDRRHQSCRQRVWSSRRWMQMDSI